MKKITTLLFAALIFSCNPNPRTLNTLKVEGNNDTCYTLADSVKREIEIIENTLQDTVAIGFVVIPPKYVGNVSYLEIDGRRNAVIYPETPAELMPKTAMICINLYKQRKVRGYLVLRLKN